MWHTGAMKLTLSEALSKRVAAAATEHGFDDAEGYILALLENDWRQADGRFEELVIEGLESGEPVDATPEFWEEHKRRFLESFPDAAPYV